MLHTAVIIPLFLALVGGGIFAGFVSQANKRETYYREIATAAVLPTLKSFPDQSITLALMDFPMLDLLAQTDLSKNTLPSPPPEVEKLTEWLSRLDARDKELLRVRKEDFDRLQESERKEYVESWVHCCSHQECSSIQRTAAYFAALLQSMESGKRAKLQMLPKDEFVKRLKEEAYLKVSLWYADNLDQSDRRAINMWVERDLLPVVDNPNEVWRWLIWMGSLDQLPFRNHDEIIANLTPKLSPNAQKM